MTDQLEAEARRNIREIVVAMAPDQARSAMTDPSLVDDLGYHSLALLELAFALEDEYQLPPIDQERAFAIVTARDVEDYVIDQLIERERNGVTG